MKLFKFQFPLFLEKAPPLKERQRSRLGTDAPGDVLDSLASNHLQPSDSQSVSSRSSYDQGSPSRPPSGNQALTKGDSVDGSRQPSQAKQMLTRMQMKEKESSTML